MDALVRQVTIAINTYSEERNNSDRPTKNALYIGQRYFDTTLTDQYTCKAYAFGVATWAFF